jgi:hypothetical protein
MKSQQEIQLSDDLRQLVAGPPIAVDLEAIERRGRQSRRTGIAVKAVAGLAVALVAGAAIAVQGGAGGAGPAPSKSSVVTAAYVARQVEATLADASNFIVRTTQQGSSGGPVTQWTDPRTGSSYGVQGTGSAKELSWGSTYFVARVLHWRTTEADYSTRTWFVSVAHAAEPVQGPLPAGLSVPGGTPQQITQELKAGTFKIVGHGEVNGHQATELQLVLGSFQDDLWVDSTTYQPVREIRTLEIRTLNAPAHVDRITLNESWIPRTPALVNIANHPQIPAGFRQVAPPQ